MNTMQVIISVGAEGGSLTLIGKKDAALKWRFARGVLDQTPSFLSKEDGGDSTIRHTSDWVNTWSEAMALLDRYPWGMLSALVVHPEFRARVWTEVNRRLDRESSEYSESRRRRWAEVCRIAEYPHQS